jgi:hypothetical protein
VAVITGNLGRNWCSRVLLGASIVLWFFPCPLGAQDRPQSSIEPATTSTSTDYDKLLDRAVEAFEAKDYPKARELFEQAYVIRPNARVLRGLGISALHLERFGVAKRELTEALREPEQPLTANQREGVTELLSWMRVNLGTLQLLLDPLDAQVMLDHKPVEETQLVLKPGAHHVRVSFNGYITEEHTVQVAAGQDYTLRITLAPKTSGSAPTPVVSAAAAAEAAPSAAVAGSSRSPLQPAGQPVRDDESSSVLEQWWFWTAIGVVVAGGVATGVALSASAPPTTSYEKGGLGGVLMPLMTVGRAP